MRSTVRVGDFVQTPLGKGVVREVRNGGRLQIDVGGTALILHVSDVAPADIRSGKTSRKSKSTAAPERDPLTSEHALTGRSTPGEIDLHGMTVEEALARVEDAVNHALLADAMEVRLIHGRSGGRLRAAVHRWLREVPSVRGFRLDPRNPGVTIVSF
jgi:DNA mismatch repair protein MutS2